MWVSWNKDNYKEKFKKCPMCEVEVNFDTFEQAQEHVREHIMELAMQGEGDEAVVEV